LCRSEIGLYQNCRGADRVAFVNVRASPGDIAPGLDSRAVLARFHVRLADGTLVSGAAAFAMLWQVLPNWPWLGRFTRLPCVRPPLKRLYRALLKVRPALQWCARRWEANGSG